MNKYVYILGFENYEQITVEAMSEQQAETVVWNLKGTGVKDVRSSQYRIVDCTEIKEELEGKYDNE